ncbi:hypothetical protein HNP32_001725 [Brevundimonas bullata]|uniref:DUF4145 domain-containing protein n=1 Tax=Brevundimonas bullata TaxID=13160 RepID=A0A7W7N435_9CAUL|nr:DUF4145 domain-containing protein [Brevundimonas bullata]MBB4798001.1 hypothetical protein [Brevundimonas bullata]MBB6382960.1 hypothetical protein [Brevundimonas bullata]
MALLAVLGGTMAVHSHNCPHCGTDSVAFHVAWSYAINDAHRVAVGICGKCRLPLTTYLYGYETSPEKFAGDLTDRWQVVDVWPAQTELSAPRHTPQNVARRYLEGEEAYRRQSWNAAVAMYRSALDIGTKTMPGVPEGLSFFNRLKWLHEHHHITQQMKDWADHVRVEGNEALHDPDEFEEADAKPLRLFTETFLRYIYELPGEVAVFRGEVPAA